MSSHLDRISQTLHEALLEVGDTELKQLASAINVYRNVYGRTYGNVKRSQPVANLLLTAIEEAMEVRFDDKWKEFNEPELWIVEFAGRD